MHVRPIVAASLAALLRFKDWRVSAYANDPGDAAMADVIIADNDTGLMLA